MKSFRLFIILLVMSCPVALAQQDSNEDLNLPEGMLENTDSLIAAWNMSKFYQIDTLSQLADINP